LRDTENITDIRLKKTFLYIIVSAAALLVTSCAEDTIVEPDVFNGGITGQVTFISGSFGSFARVNLQDLSNNRTTIDTSDQDGMFEFGELKGGDYKLSFVSTGYDIHTFSLEITLPENETIYENLYIVYKMLDDEKQER